MGKDYDDDIGSKHEGCASMCIVIAIIFSLVVLLLYLCACKTQYKVVEVPRVVTQTNVEHRTNIVRDTIPQIVTVTKTEIKEVEKPLSRWQRLKMRLGGWLLAAVAVLLLGGGGYGILKLKKK